MREKSALKYILKVVALAGLMCVLPIFSNEVKADDVYPRIYKPNGTDLADEGEGKDYEIESGTVRLRRNKLVIKGESGKIYNCNIFDAYTGSDTHCFTIDNLNITTSAGSVLNLNALVGDSTAYPVELYVKGNCTLINTDLVNGNGITGNDLMILPKTNGATLNIEADTAILLGDYAEKLEFGDGNGTRTRFVVSTNSKSYGLTNNSSKEAKLTINKGVELSCSGGANTKYFINDFMGGTYIYGKLRLDHTYDGEDGTAAALPIKNKLVIGPDADVLIKAKRWAAISNSSDDEYTEQSLNMNILGSKEYTSDLSLITQKAYIQKIQNSSTPGYSRIVGTDDVAKSIIIKKSSGESSKKKATNKKLFFNFFIEPETVDENEPEVVDYDTFKSEAPGKTVIAADTLDAQTFFDLKVHSADERTIANQKLIVQNQVGPNAQILLTKDIYPRRDLSTTENGSLKVLIWNNLPKNLAGPVSAVVYNQTDGTYVISGTLDNNGTATFTGFKLRPASTVTICK